MPDLAALEVVLDPRKAEAGAKRSVAAIKSVGTAAQQMAATVNKAMDKVAMSTRRVADKLAPSPQEARRIASLLAKNLETAAQRELARVGGRLGRVFGDAFSKGASRSVERGVSKIITTLNRAQRPARQLGIQIGKAFRDGAQAATRFERRAKDALRGVNSAGRRLTSSGGGLAFLGGAGITGLAGALGLREFITQTVEAGNAFQTVRAGLTAVFKDGSLAGETINFLTAETTRLGASFVRTAPEFTKLAAAARSAGLTNREVEQSFTGVLEAARVFNLGAARTSLVFNAFTQILSKGRLQSEELRRQLGDSLPGAFELAAKSLGISTQELNKRLAEGLIDARTFIQAFIPALQAEVERGLPSALQSLQAQFQGFTNRVQLTLNEIAQGGFFDGLTAGLKALSGVLGAPEVIPTARELGAVLGEISEEIGVKFAAVLENVSKNAEVFIQILKIIGTVINIVIGGIKFLTQNAGLLRIALVAIIGIPIAATIKLFAGALRTVFGNSLKQSISLVDLLTNRLRILNQTAKTTQATVATATAQRTAAGGATLFGRPISGGGADPTTRRGRFAQTAGSAGGLLAISVGLQAAKGPINEFTKGINVADSEVNKFVRGGLRAMPDALNAAIIAFQLAPGPIGAVLAAIAGGAVLIIESFSDALKALEEANRKLTKFANEQEAIRQRAVTNTKARADLEQQLSLRAQKVLEEGNATLVKRETALRKVNDERIRVGNEIEVEQGNIAAGITQELSRRLAKLELTRESLEKTLKTEEDFVKATENVTKEIDAQNEKVLELGKGFKDAFIAQQERPALIQQQVDALQKVNDVTNDQISQIDTIIAREKELIRLRQERRAAQEVRTAIQEVQPALTSIGIDETVADEAIALQIEADTERIIDSLQRRVSAIIGFAAARGSATERELRIIKLIAQAEVTIELDKNNRIQRAQLMRARDVDIFNQRLLNSRRDFNIQVQQQRAQAAGEDLADAPNIQSRIDAAETLARAQILIVENQKELELQALKNAEANQLATVAGNAVQLARIRSEFSQRRISLAQRTAFEIEQINKELLENTKSQTTLALEEIGRLAGDADAFIAGAFESAFGAAEEALVQFVRTGKVEFEDLIGNILDQLTRLAVQQAIIGPLANLLNTGTGAGQGAGSLGQASGSQGIVGLVSQGAQLLGGLFNTGGVAGVDNVSTRSLSRGQIARAQRFQAGGITAGGGGPDTIPALLSPGEAVFTPGQMAAMGDMGGSTVVQNNITVNATDAQSFTARRTQDQISTTVAQSTERALNRNNVNLRNRQ